MIRLHASCVAIGAHGVLLLGDSSAGKSDLAIRLIDRGAVLVADDQVELSQKGDMICASAPASISGLIELRGVGILTMPSTVSIPLLLAVQLAKKEWIERLPEPEPYHCFGIEIPQFRLWSFEPSAAVKVEMAVAALLDGSMTVGAFKE